MDQARAVFRPEALQRYAQSSEQAVLPRFIKLRGLLYLWVLGLLLLAGLTTLWLARVPVYVAGSAVVIDRQMAGWSPLGGDRHELAVAVFLPPEARPKLKAGQPLYLQFRQQGEQVEQPLLGLDGAASSPEEVGRRFRLTNVGLIINQPVLVATTRYVHEHHGLAPDALREELDHTRYLGSVGQAFVPIGSRRLLSFVPVIGDLIGTEEE